MRTGAFGFSAFERGLAVELRGLWAAAGRQVGLFSPFKANFQPLAVSDTEMLKRLDVHIQKESAACVF